jgi:hypothetical protein
MGRKGKDDILTCNKRKNMENGCKQNTVSQHDYIKKRLACLFFQKKLFDMKNFETMFLQFVI